MEGAGEDAGAPAGDGARLAARGVQSASDAQARLRALAACERRMGLAKTSWEEDERERALHYVQQDRDKQRLALQAAERRMQDHTGRGRPHAAARPPGPAAPPPAAMMAPRADAAGARVLHETPVPHGHGAGSNDDGAWQDESFDDGGASGDALSRIARVAAAINRTSFEVGAATARAGMRAGGRRARTRTRCEQARSHAHCIDGRLPRHTGAGFGSEPAVNVFGAGGGGGADGCLGQPGGTQDFCATQDTLDGDDGDEQGAGPAHGGGFECDASDIDGMSSGSHAGDGADAFPRHAPDEEQAEAEDDAEEEEEEEEEEEVLTTPQRLGKIRDIALGILAGGGGPGAAVGAGRGADAFAAGETGAGGEGGDDAHAQRAEGGAGGSFEDVDAEEARMWVEEAQVGAEQVIARVLQSMLAAAEEGRAEEHAVAVAAGVDRRIADRERRRRAAEERHVVELRHAQEEQELACRAARNRAHALLFSQQHHRQELPAQEEDGAGGGSWVQAGSCEESARSRHSSLNDSAQVAGGCQRSEPASHASHASQTSQTSHAFQTSHAVPVRGEDGGASGSLQGEESGGLEEDGGVDALHGHGPVRRRALARSRWLARLLARCRRDMSALHRGGSRMEWWRRRWRKERCRRKRRWNPLASKCVICSCGAGAWQPRSGCSRCKKFRCRAAASSTKSN